MCVGELEPKLRCFVRDKVVAGVGVGCNQPLIFTTLCKYQPPDLICGELSVNASFSYD